MLTNAHTQVGFANPFLVCIKCNASVRYWHDPTRCGPECVVPVYNFPCEHTNGIISLCDSWSSVDGCRCINKETHDRQ